MPSNCCIIHYTTNGNTPTTDSPVYSTPLLLSKNLYSRSDIYTIRNCPEKDWYCPDSVQHCIVIRAAAFDGEGNKISPVVTNSYLIQSLGCDTHGLPVVSPCADSLDLFDYETGIFVPGIHYDTTAYSPIQTGNYYQTGNEWERPCNVEYYEKGKQGINQEAGIRTQGNASRHFSQKSLKLYARDKYGKKHFKCKFFDNLDIEKYKRLRLKPFQSGYDSIGCQDYISGLLAQNLNIDALSSRPVVLFLNGEYWGIYFLQEKPDERFLESHYFVDFENINIIDHWRGTCEHGSNSNYLELYDWIENNNLSIEANYQYVSNKIDIANFIDYQIFEIFIANKDWPNNNMRCWQEGDGQWRWIFFDGDASLLKADYDAFLFATYEGEDFYMTNGLSTLFFRKFMENSFFKEQFLSRFVHLLSTTLNYNTTQPFYYNTMSQLSDEVVYQSRRFGNPKNLEIWLQDIQEIDYFLSQRKTFIDYALRERFVGDSNNIHYCFVSPNPTHYQIQVIYGVAETAITDFAIFSIHGQLIHQSVHVAMAGQNHITIPIHLKQGVYILRIGNKSKKFVVTG